MKELNNYIIEKLRINKDLKSDQCFKDNISEETMNYLTGNLHYTYGEDYEFKIWNNPELKDDDSVELSINLISSIMRCTSERDLRLMGDYIKDILENIFKEYKFSLRLDFKNQNIGIGISVK